VIVGGFEVGWGVMAGGGIQFEAVAIVVEAARPRGEDGNGAGDTMLEAEGVKQFGVGRAEAHQEEPRAGSGRGVGGEIKRHAVSQPPSVGGIGWVEQRDIGTGDVLELDDFEVGVLTQGVCGEVHDLADHHGTDPRPSLPRRHPRIGTPSLASARSSFDLAPNGHSVSARLADCSFVRRTSLDPRWSFRYQQAESLNSPARSPADSLRKSTGSAEIYAPVGPF
jgi:hypothetical protein